VVIRERIGNVGRAAAGAPHTAALRKPGHDAVSANLDLPDFFEDFAGNHLFESEAARKEFGKIANDSSPR